MLTTNETSEPASSGRRRPHRKSRTGCTECRRRRIKCGEQKPSCHSCVRHDSQCMYPNIAAASSQGRTSPSPGSDRSPLHPARSSGLYDAGSPAARSSAQSPSTPALPKSDCTSAAVYTMNDLVLLHHWSLHTSREIYKSEQVDHCWHTVFPRMAFHHPFVMHGILSLAALHLAHTDRNDWVQHTMDASRHHSTSIQGFRQAINHITDDNSDALFACSTLNVLYILAMSRPANSGNDGDADTRPRTNRALGNDLIPMIRGVAAVLQPVYDRVRLGPLSQLTELGNWDELDIDRDTVPDDEYFRRIRDTWRQVADPQAYDETLRTLRRCHLYIVQFRTMDEDSLRKWGYNRGWAGPLMFLHLAPEEYFTRLHQRQPPALVIFAYFGALMHELNDIWFLEGWGRQIVEVTDALLGDYWSDWMEWPKRILPS